MSLLAIGSLQGKLFEFLDFLFLYVPASILVLQIQHLVLPLIVEVEVLVVKICWLVASTEAVLVLWVLVEVVEVAVEDVSMVVAVKEE